MIRDKRGNIYYSVKEVAHLLKVSDQTVYAWTRTGRLKFVRHRIREKLISEKELEKLLESYNFFG